jgi:hypothetical protein
LPSDGWHVFHQDLAEALADLAEGETLILATEDTEYFLQFAGMGQRGMRLEAVSNAYLGAECRLGDAAFAHLTSLGWSSPTYFESDVSTAPPEGSPNFFIDAPCPVEHSELARIAVRTLREVHGAVDPSNLLYRAYSLEFTSIRFSLLGATRCDTLEEQCAKILREIEPEYMPPTQLPLMMPLEVS